MVYTTLRPSDLDIYLFEEPGGSPTRLTSHPALDYNAVFSPDGRWIVFTSERNGNADLYALELASGDLLPLTHHDAMDDAASFSPDGRRLVFVSTRDGDADVFAMPFDPGLSAEERAVNLTRRSGGDFNPAFSPDGRSIAYSRQDDLWTTGNLAEGNPGAAATDVYVMGDDGSHPRRVSEPGAISGSPAWSLDGAVLYYSQVGPQGAQVRRVSLDGSGDRVVALLGMSPALRADGRIGYSLPLGSEVPGACRREEGIRPVAGLSSCSASPALRSSRSWRRESPPGDRFGRLRPWLQTHLDPGVHSVRFPELPPQATRGHPTATAAAGRSGSSRLEEPFHRDV